MNFLRLLWFTVALSVLSSSAQAAKEDETSPALLPEAAPTPKAVAEIERGIFVKGGVGVNAYLLKYGSGSNPEAILDPGLTLSIAVGGDFVDKESQSMSWEVAFFTGLYNGMHYEDQALLIDNPDHYIQGDTAVFGLMGYYEYSGYPTRRLGIGGRVGAGIIYTPLLMNKDTYEQDVVRDTWGLTKNPAVHRQPVHPIISIGPTLEYYPKLSHFSFGVDIDLSYAFGFDLGLGGQVFLKYTF